jgi:hypothetical protein
VSALDQTAFACIDSRFLRSGTQAASTVRNGYLYFTCSYLPLFLSRVSAQLKQNFQPHILSVNSY